MGLEDPTSRRLLPASLEISGETTAPPPRRRLSGVAALLILRRRSATAAGLASRATAPTEALLETLAGVATFAVAVVACPRPGSDVAGEDGTDGSGGRLIAWTIPERATERSGDCGSAGRSGAAAGACCRCGAVVKGTA